MNHSGIQKWLNTTFVLLCLLVFAIGMLPRFAWCSLILLVLMLIGLYLKFAGLFVLGLACALTVLLRKAGAIGCLLLPPLPIALSLIVGLVIGKLALRSCSWGDGRSPNAVITNETFDWFKKGDLGPQQIAIIAAISTISATSLVCWFWIVKPDISDLAAIIPHAHPVILIAIGLLFAVTNAICEELFWRGMIFGVLERTLLPAAGVVSIQALSFGMAHFHGFPRGASGIVLASIYGYMLGRLRQNAKGLLAPVAAHVFADLVIYAILAHEVLSLNQA